MRRSAAQDDSTGGAGLAATEPDQFVLTHHDLVDQRALTWWNQVKNTVMLSEINDKVYI